MDDWKLNGSVCCIHHKIGQFLHQIKTRDDLIETTRECFEPSTSNISHFQQLRYVFANYSTSACQGEGDATEIPNDYSQIFLVLWILIMVVTSLGNSLLITVILRSSILRKGIANIFILSLAFSDLCVGIFILPFKCNQALMGMRFTLPIGWCRFYVTVDNIFFTISITNLLAISVDRYIALNFPYKYSHIVTKLRYRIVVLLIWTYGAVWGSLSNLHWSNATETSIKIKQHICMTNNNHLYVISMFLVIFLIPVVIMGYIYVQILIIARKHALKIRTLSKTRLHEDLSSSAFLTVNHSDRRSSRASGASSTPSPLIRTRNLFFGEDFSSIARRQSSNASNSSNNKARMQEYKKIIFKASKTVAVIYGTFVVAWSPVCVISLILATCRQESCLSEWNWHFSVLVEVFPFLSSMLNPFIYGVMNKQYRRAFHAMLESYRLIKTKQPRSSLRKNDNVNGSTFASTGL